MLKENKDNNNNKKFEIVVSYDTEELAPVYKDSFRKFFNEKLSEYNDDNGTELKAQDIGDRLGITGKDMFKKKLNHEKNSTKRDFIIAVSITLELNLADTNEAIRLYNYTEAKNYIQMLPLTKEDKRDNFIISQLNYNNYPCSVAELNRRLKANGFSELDIHDSRDKKPSSVSTPNSKYSKLELLVRTPIPEEYYYSDPYNSLATAYDPANYKCVGKMAIKDNTSNHIFCLTADNGKYLASELLNRKDSQYKSYDSLSETGDFERFFSELQSAINNEYTKITSVLNDTKNYKKRLSAHMHEDALQIYAEEFNYTIPELQEYFVVIRTHNIYEFRVYKKSAFMHYYLSEENYLKYYGNDIPVPSESFKTMEELDKALDKTDDYNNSIKYKIYKRAYQRLIESIDNLLDDIRNRKQFPFNLNYICDCPAEVLGLYGLEEDYDCQYNEYNDICGCGKSENKYTLPDGTEVIVTLAEIMRAYELGFGGIEDICRVKAHLGSLEAVLD